MGDSGKTSWSVASDWAWWDQQMNKGGIKVGATAADKQVTGTNSRPSTGLERLLVSVPSASRFRRVLGRNLERMVP